MLTLNSGDSYTRTLWKINGPVPSEQNPIGNPPLPGGTSSGGKNWVGLLVTKFNVSSVFLYNFASSGAPIDKTLLAPQPLLSDRVDFVNQVQLFNKTLSAAPSWAPWTAQNSIAAMWLNVKDLRDTLDYPNTPDISKRVMKRYMEQVERLYAMGVRNFIFLTAPPFYLTPLFFGLNASSYNKLVSATDNFNSQLLGSVAAFASSHPDATVRTIDTLPAFLAAFQNPTKFGAPNSACVHLNGRSCVRFCSPLWFHASLRSR
ncbi:hypothetical protein BGZ61DRAFT_219602 [Ilyonectria robusta]|uniref:uncharacterized protein n=1 Tax=Ilyonectria robusta TaxID=1079257 RepID=UPI001E8E5A0A|nr:uncharacterized protein BGZ61DRAFT_219602 [Ilyonectria robusta]KAH8706347.1 hypothetical protein BGZ61DRAFT_219602 [Ilyonectria robusta]